MKRGKWGLLFKKVKVFVLTMHVQTLTGMAFEGTAIDFNLIDATLETFDRVTILINLTLQLCLLSVQTHDAPRAMLADKQHVEQEKTT